MRVHPQRAISPPESPPQCCLWSLQLCALNQSYDDLPPCARRFRWALHCTLLVAAGVLIFLCSPLSSSPLPLLFLSLSLSLRNRRSIESPVRLKSPYTALPPGASLFFRPSQRAECKLSRPINIGLIHRLRPLPNNLQRTILVSLGGVLSTLCVLTIL